VSGYHTTQTLFPRNPSNPSKSVIQTNGIYPHLIIPIPHSTSLHFSAPVLLCNRWISALHSLRLFVYIRLVYYAHYGSPICPKCQGNLENPKRMGRWTTGKSVTIFSKVG